MKEAGLKAGVCLITSLSKEKVEITEFEVRQDSGKLLKAFRIFTSMLVERINVFFQFF